VLKQHDFPCRYGGEEFAVIMPNTTVQNGRIAAGRVRKAIELLDVEFEGKQLSVTASVGVAEIRDDDDDVRLIRRADEAVYASKEAGRNCGHWHDGESCLPLKVSSPGEPETEGPKPNAAVASSSSANVIGRLPDKNVFSSELRRRISESHRFGVPLSVMYLRVKDHDSLVHTYGEAVGDLVLDSVVTFIQSALRDMDLLATYDASEFVVMLPGSSEAEAKQVARRLRTAITQCELPLGDSQLKLAVDHGVADVRPDDEVQSMIDRAIEVTEQNMEVAPVGAR
jgi:diguanylate cyclase